ncbi:WG repeat-containing protein [Spongiivirga citrea]|uniref:WG repeat-containing protein n=1 Tax=Spongiivirga citrea TaxID=1481457 RepID=A0A6M0CEN2_9FLAO|nr:WG repeat-containing protein [Spongiivirga citrea]NER16275.1 hypothetical protein [Spongiivirga citrea]
MKSTLILLFFAIMPFLAFSQDIVAYEAIGELSEDLIAVKKNSSWGFIDSNNKVIINFKDNIVSENYWMDNEKKYPLFKNGLCIIVEYKDDIPYYGYINKTGTIVIKPQFLNVSNFNNGYALATVINKRVKGVNQYLNKEIISYDFFEAIIDTKGGIVKVLRDIPYLYMRPKDYEKPYSNSRFIGENMLAVQNKASKWEIVSFNK